MSTTIDQRVVQMEFDNRQFESNVQTSLSTLDKLKKSLNLDGASKGLAGIDSAAKKVDLSSLGGAAETVGLKFNAMYTMADQALRNITNRVQHTAEKMFNAITIDPIKTGLQEYETQIGAVQTILANTESKGSTLNDVSAALDELNTYADKTIYNFTEMTRNIGTFTAAGVDLDKSVTSIKGIANLAAVSGSSSQQASTAMYQLSQALAAGKVQLMDWNSVVNAGMGGQVFQDALKRTASQMGYNVDEMIKKYGSFRESLTKGEWLTAEVLTETLTQLSGAYSEADLVAQGYTEEQAKEISKLAETAVNAATKVKTYTQLIDTLKESLQSGWTQTWELLIGDFEEAKSLWTGVSDTLGGIINDSSQRRNDLLSGALNNNWDKMMDKINEAGVETSVFEEKLTSVLKENGYAVDKMIEKHGSLEKAFTSGAVSSKWLNKAVSELSTNLVDLTKIEGNLEKGQTGENITKLQEALKSMGYDLGKSGIDGVFGSMTEDAVKAFQELNGLDVTGIVDEKTLAALQEATGETKNLTSAVGGYIEEITKLGGRESIIQSFKNVWEALVRIVTPIKEAFREVFPPATSEQLYNVIEAVRNFTEKLIASDETVENIKRTFKGLFSVVSVFVSIIKSIGSGIVKIISSFTGLGGGLTGVTGAIGDWLTSLSESIKKGNIFGKAIDKIVGIITNAVDKIKEFGKSLKESFSAPESAGGIFGFFVNLWNIITKIGSSIGRVLGSITTVIADAFGKGDIFEVLNSGMLTGTALSITKFVKSLSNGFDNAGGFLENLTGILDDVRGCFQAYQDQIKAGTLMKIATAIGILAAAIFVISTIDPDKLAQSLGAITVLFAELLGSLAIFNKLGGTFKGTMKAIPLMIAMATAIAILGVAMKTISSISMEGIVKGLVAIGVLMAELSIFLSTAKFNGKMTGTALGIVLLSSAMVILAKAVKDFGNMKWAEIGKGLAAIGALLLEISLFTKLTGNAKKVLATGASMVLLGASMKIFASAMKDFGTMKWEEIGKGLVAMGGALAEVIIAMRLMPKGAVFNAVGLIAAAAALKIMYSSLSGFGSMSWEEIGKGLVAMGGALIELAIGLNLMKGTIAGSASLLIASAALAVIAPVMKSLGKMSWGQIGKGLVALAGAFTVIGIAGALLAPLVPILLGIAAAALVFGVGVAAIGAGLVLIGAGITSLSLALAAGAISIVSGLSTIILGILNLVPEIVQIIGQTILGVAVLIGDYAPLLAESFCKLLVETVESLATYAPQLVNSLLDLLVDLINGLADHIPTLITAFTNLLGKVFEGVVVALNNTDTTNLLKGIAAVGLMAIIARLLSGMLTVLPSAMIGLAAVGVLIAELALVLAAVGQIAKITGVEDGIEKAGDILNGIGVAIGKFISGIGEGLTSGLPAIAQNIADFMDKLAVASENAKGVDGTAFDGVSQLIGVMAEIALTTVGTSISDIFTLGGTSMEKFETDGVAFFNAMKAISTASAGITLDEDSIGSVIGIATRLSDLQSSLEPIGGVVDWFTGRDDLGTFGTSVGEFFSSMTAALNGLGTVSFDIDSLNAIVDAATNLSDLQSSLEPIGGVVDWFTGRDDLGTFGTNIGSFISSMVTGLGSLTGVTINSEALGPIIDAATRLSDLQSSLENIGGVVDWFTGKDDLATFGDNIAVFIGSMKTALADLDGVTSNAEALTSIVDAATRLSDLQTSLDNIGGVVDWFTGRDDLATFGNNIAVFIGSMKTAMANLGEDSVNSEALTSIIDAATKLADLQSSLTNMDGVISWFTGHSDLGTFGTKIGEFATAMGTLKTSMGEDGISDSVVTSITNAGAALVELNNTLPEKGWFDSKEDLTSFSGHITSFATAISDFSNTCSTLNADGINVAITAAQKIRRLIENIADLDTTGVVNFAGYGGYASDSAISSIADALVDFGNKVMGVDVGAISTASTAATKIKNLIAGLVDLDTSGIGKFKIDSIGIAMKSYSEKVTGIDSDSISTSISAANKIKNLINNLASIDTSGVGKFNSALSTLGEANVSGFTEKFSSASTQLSSIGSDMMSSLSKSISSNSSSVTSAASSVIDSLSKSISSKSSLFTTIGSSLITNLVKGIAAKSSDVKSSVISLVVSVSSGFSSGYTSFYNAGSYLVTGFANGISANSYIAAARARAMAKAAKDAAEDELDINSPSRVFYGIGDYAGQGFVNALIDNVSKSYKAGSKMAESAKNGLSEAMARASELINVDMETQPTIRPILDLSDVKDGASVIGNMFNAQHTVGVAANLNAISSSMNIRSQNGVNSDVVSAIDKLSKQLNNVSGNTYNLNGITYDDGSTVSNAVSELVRAIRIEGRV